MLKGRLVVLVALGLIAAGSLAAPALADPPPAPAPDAVVAVTAKLVEIRWPSGVVQKFENVATGQMLKITER